MWTILVLGLSMSSPFSIESLKRIAQEQAAAPVVTTPTPVAPDDADWPLVVMYAGQGADAATTLAAWQQGRYRELHPAGFAGTLALKAGGTALMHKLIRHFQHTGHPTAAKAQGIIMGAAGAIPAAWNLRQLLKD